MPAAIASAARPSGSGESWCISSSLSWTTSKQPNQSAASEQRLEHPDAVVLHAQEQAVQVGVDGTTESLAERLGGAETELEPGDEVEVERVQVGHHRSQLAPGPGRHPARHPLAVRRSGDW